MAVVAPDLALGPDGDLLIADGDLALVDGIEAVQQDAQCALQLFLGEWFLAPDEGVPYFEEILVKAPSLPRIRTILTEALRARPGILDVTEMTVAFEAKTRRLTGSFRARSAVGEITGRIGALWTGTALLLDDGSPLLLDPGAPLLLE